MSNVLGRMLRAATTLIFCVISLPAELSYAQSQDATVIEEIVVTSRYRAEKLSDVPDSITPFTVDEIERYRIERINRVASLTPNLRFSDDQEVA